MGDEGAKAIAEALHVNASLTSVLAFPRPYLLTSCLHGPPPSPQLDLSANRLCGVEFGRGTYTSEGIIAIANALHVNASLTSVLAFST